MRGISEERLDQLFNEFFDSDDYSFEACANKILSECQELNQWQDISSAPKDRDLILLFDDIGTIRGKWCEFCQFHAPNELIYFKSKPTHWMELPEQPEG